MGHTDLLVYFGRLVIFELGCFHQAYIQLICLNDGAKELEHKSAEQRRNQIPERTLSPLLSSTCLERPFKASTFPARVKSANLESEALNLALDINNPVIGVENAANAQIGAITIC